MSKDKEAIDTRELITQTEAAKLRGVSLEAINNLVRRRRLSYTEMFGRKLVYRTEVLALEKQKTGPKGPWKRQREHLG